MPTVYYSLSRQSAFERLMAAFFVNVQCSYFVCEQQGQAFAVSSGDLYNCVQLKQDGTDDIHFQYRIEHVET